LIILIILGEEYKLVIPNSWRKIGLSPYERVHIRSLASDNLLPKILSLKYWGMRYQAVTWIVASP
jgi:hypothetical protein